MVLKDMVAGGAVLKVAMAQNHADRPTLVFLHDSLGCIRLWRDFPAMLAAATRCNLLVYDRQGYGQSAPFGPEKRTAVYLEHEADVLNELLDACGINHAILFGHSDGGSIALVAAAKYGRRICGLVTEGAHIFVEDITLEGIRAACEAYRTTDLKEKLQKYHAEKTEAVFSAWADTWLSQDFRLWNIEQYLPRIVCPVLVIQGENDAYGTMAQVWGITRQVKSNARLLMIPGTGHTPHKEAKETVLEEAAAFIRSLSC